MGYLTYYRLACKPEFMSVERKLSEVLKDGYSIADRDNPIVTVRIHVLESIQNTLDRHSYLQSILSDNGEKNITWYDHESEMLEISHLYPSVTFKLSGEGEDSGDIWVKYFRNGKLRTAEIEITLPDFDNLEWEE